MADQIGRFKRDNDAFSQEYEKQKLMIRRYDEILTLKASKLDLQEEIGTLEAKSKKEISNLHEIAERLKASISDHADALNHLAAEIRNEIDSQLAKVLAEVADAQER